MKKIHLIIALIGLSLSVIGQDLPNDEINVIKEFQVNLEDVDRVELPAELPPLDTVRRVQPYSILSKLLTLKYDAPQIQPIPFKEDIKVENYNGYVKLGIGYPLMPLAEVGYRHYVDKLLIGGRASYRGLFNDRELENQRFTDLDTEINSTYFFDDGFALGADLKYNFDRIHYYGYDNELVSFNREDVEQNLNKIGAGLHFKNTQKNVGDIFYTTNLNYYNLRGKFGEKENGIQFSGIFGKQFGGRHTIQGEIKNDYFKLSTNTIGGGSSNILAFIPSYHFHHKRFYAKVGINTSWIGEKEFRFLPNVELMANAYQNKVAVKAGWKGYIENNSYASLFEINPFINHRNTSLLATEINYPYVSINGDFGKYKGEIEGGYEISKNQLFFTNDYLFDATRFASIYDDARIIHVKLNGEVEIIKYLSLNLGLHYRNIQTENIIASHYHPNIEINIGIRYSGLLNQKLILGMDIFGASDRKYIALTGLEEDIKGFVDVNLLAEYKWNENWRFFLEAKNITNQRYQTWNGYDNLGINAMVGVFYKF